jgi:uncharacterized damage-inducible protein DinB
MRQPAAALVLALCAPALCAAQTAKSAGPISGAIRSQWDSAKKNLSDSAQLMPEADFAFKPTAAVRTFGAILAHVAGANYVFCSAALGQKSPHAEDEFEKSATTKAAITKALGDSIAYCDKAYSALTDQNAAENVTTPFGSAPTPRAGALVANVGHLAEHYGNLVTYFRIKGIVPPTSRGQ